MNTSTTNSFLPSRASFTAASDKTVYFNYLYDNYAAALYGTILTWTSKEEAAQKILQKAFESFMQQFALGHHSTRPFIGLLKLARQQYQQSSTSSNKGHVKDLLPV